MDETVEFHADDDTGVWARDSLFAFGGIYEPLGNGEYIYRGERPGPEWYGHGYFPKTLTMLSKGQPGQIRLHKHRWINTVTGRTVHSRPPDDPVLIRFCTLIVVLRVWAWVNSSVGFCHRQEAFEALETGCGSDSTVQRWTARAMEEGMEIQQAIRLSLIEEAEPRPMESLFEGGLSPPDAVTHKRWKSPSNLETLWRGYAMLLVAARKLAKHASYLLAGARRRWPTTKVPFGI